MNKQKYVIRQQDQSAAVGFLDKQISSGIYWLGEDISQSSMAEREYQGAKTNSNDLNAWCGKWLHDTQWAQLKNAISIARDQIEKQKYRPQLKTVSLTHNAWQILSELARNEGLTLSELIVNRLGNEWLNSYEENGMSTRQYIETSQIEV